MYYYQWNKALYDYYFGSEVDSVVLYVDDDIIENIGREYRLPQMDGSYLKSFLSSTIIGDYRLTNMIYVLVGNSQILDTYVLRPNVDRQERQRFLDSLQNIYREHFGNGVGNINDLAVLLQIITNRNKPVLSCPLYFAFMMVVILAAQHQPENQRSMHEAILNYLNGGNPFGFNAGINQTLARCFAQFTNSLNRFNDAFDASNARNQNIHIGKIKYHLMLSNRERDRIQRLLYAHQLQRWDETKIPYMDIIRRYVLPHLGEYDNRLRQTINDRQMSSDVIKNVLRNYSYERYQRDHMDQRLERVSDTFYFMLNLEDGIPTLSLGTTYSGTGDDACLILRGSESEMEYGLYLVETRHELRWGTDYTFGIGNVTVRTISYNELAYFEQIPGSHVYIQVERDSMVPYRNYLVVVPRERQFNTGEDVTRYYRAVFPERCVRSVYLIHDPDLVELIRGDQYGNNQRNQDTPEFEDKPGITSPRYSKNYYYNGLRYYHIDNYNPEDRDRYTIACYDEDRRRRVETILTVTDAGDIFIDIPWNDDISNMRCRFTLMMDGQEQSNGKVYNIVAEQGRPDGEILNHFKFDGWGRRVSDEVQTNYYCNGNICIEEIENHEVAQRVLEESMDAACDADFLLMNLITALCDDVTDWIDNKKLEDVIRYVAAKKGFPWLRNREIIVIKSALMELGYLDRAFDDHGQEVFQVNTLRLVTSTKQFKKGNDAYLLFGGCTGRRRREIETAIREQGISKRIRYKLPYSKSRLEREPYLVVLPPFMLVDAKAAEKLSNLLGIEKVDSWNIAGFIGFIKGIKDFDNEFLENTGTPWDNIDRANLKLEDLPRFVMDNDLGRIRLETAEGIYSHYYYNNRRIPIPSDLIKLYCQNCHDDPVIIVDEPQDSQNPHYDKVYFAKDMGIPYLLKRLFCTLNLGLQQEQYAFFVDHYCITDPRKQWYTTIKSYDVSGISDPLLRTLIEKLSTREVDENLSLTEAISESIIVNERSSEFSMKLYRNRTNYADNYLCLFEDDMMVACSMTGNNDCMFVRNTAIGDPTEFGAFYTVRNRNNNLFFINMTFSEIIRAGVPYYTEYIADNINRMNNWAEDFPPEIFRRNPQDYNEIDVMIVKRAEI